MGWQDEYDETIRARERERCAKIAENLYLNDIEKMGSRASIQQAIAAAIRNGTK